jgi:hypothetical protein
MPSVTARDHIEFEDWLDFMFDRDNEAWYIYDIDDEPWLTKSDLVLTHFITLHMASPDRLDRFTNEQIGWGLRALYDGTSVGEPLLADHVGVARIQQAILSVPELLANLVVCRCPSDESDMSNPLSNALSVFWDLVPLLHYLYRDGGYDNLIYRVMLEETTRALRIDHPVAHFHALKGLGLFGRSGIKSVKADKTRVITDWLATNPKIGPRVRHFAECAAFSEHF